MRSYEAARALFTLLGFLAWCVIIIGGIVALVGGNIGFETRSFGGPPPELKIAIGAAPGLAISFLGFLGLATVQNGRAAVDTAELTQQMLKVARDQLEVSQQALRSAAAPASSFEAVASQASGKERSGYASGGGEAKAKGDVAAAGSSSPAMLDEPAQNAVEEISYQGRSIQIADGRYLYNGIPFDSLEKAQGYIDRFGPRGEVG